MGFLDKAKEAANQAMASAQQAAAQGQAKIEAYQSNSSANELFRQLGVAFYAEQRHSGGTDAVVAALSALDSHYAAAQAQAAAQGQPVVQAQAEPVQQVASAPPVAAAPPPPVAPAPYTPATSPTVPGAVAPPPVAPAPYTPVSPPAPPVPPQ